MLPLIPSQAVLTLVRDSLYSSLLVFSYVRTKHNLQSAREL